MKRLMKRILTCILCVTMLAGSISLPAQAAVSDEYTADEIVEVIVERLNAEIAKRPTASRLEVNVSDMGIQADSVVWESANDLLFDRVIYNNYNRTFFVSGVVPYVSRTDAGDIISDVHFWVDSNLREASTGNINWAKIDYFTELVDSEVEVAMTLLNDDMTIAEKALVLQNFLCQNTEYQCISFHNLPVGALANGGAKCSGYATTYALLLHAAGIECQVITSVELNHAWVMVQLEDGTWYHTDPTWDDKDNEETIKYIYFLHGDEIYRRHHLSWDGIVPVAPKDYAFEGYAFYGLGSMLNYYNGDWYYLVEGSDQSYIVMTEFDGSNKEWIPLNVLTKNMVGYKDKLYHNNSSQVYEYDITTGANKLVYDISQEYPDARIAQCVIKHQKQLVLTVADYRGERLAEIVIDLEPTEWESAFLSTDAIKLTESGETRQLEVNFVPFYADSFPEVCWSSEDESVAMVNAEGLVTAISEGTTTIIATTPEGRELGCCQVEVSYGIQITGYYMYEDVIVLNSIGETGWISSSFIPNEAADYENLIWESADPTVAQVNEWGDITAVYYGRTVITATTKDGRFSDSCEVVVDPDAAKGMALSHQNVYMYAVGQTFQLTAEVCPDTVSDKRVIWSSTDNNVATVDENGMVTIVGGGECQIMATAVNGGYTRTCNIYAEIPDEWGVYPSQKVPATTVTLNIVKKEVTQKYETIQLTATVEPMEATHKMIHWKSTNPSVAVVDSTGLVTVIGKGNCVISATTVDGSCSELCQISANWEDTEEDDQLAAFVERMYTIVLGRDAVESEVNEWVDNLRNWRVDGAELADGFVNGTEFKNRGLGDSDYVDVLYRAFMNREADENGKNGWLNALAGGMTREEVLNMFIDSTEFRGLCEEYGIVSEFTKEDLVTNFVERMYTVVLNREAVESDVKGWADSLLNWTIDGAELADGFINSNELKERNLSNGEYIDVLYRAIMNREADQGGKDGWLNALAGGMTREEVLNEFVKSPEFDSLCEEYGILAVITKEDLVRGFVERMYTVVLGREAVESEVEGWTQGLLNQSVYGAKVAYDFIASPEFEAKNVDDGAYVEVLYQALFKRVPSDADKASWVENLEKGMTRNDALRDFLNSEEFEIVCTNYGILRGEVQ